MEAELLGGLRVTCLYKSHLDHSRWQMETSQMQTITESFRGVPLGGAHFTGHCLLPPHQLPPGWSQESPQTTPFLFCRNVSLSSLKPRHQKKGNFLLLLKPLSKYFSKDPSQNKTGIIHLLSKKYLLSIYYRPDTILGPEAPKVNTRTASVFLWV